MATADFKACISSIYNGSAEDVASKALRRAYESRYPDVLSTVQRGLLYPNTATLLRHGFPQQRWKMRLHDVDPDKQNELRDWVVKNHERVVADVEGDWSSSSQLERCPVPRDRPSILMLDPNQVCDALPNTSKPGFYLTPQLVANILGEHRLNFFSRDVLPLVPQVALVFSYSEANPGSTDRRFREGFANSDLRIDRITAADTFRGMAVFELSNHPCRTANSDGSVKTQPASA